MIGILIVMYNGKALRLSLKGDFIAMISAISFSIYSILVKSVNKKYSQIFVVRKMFFYGVLTMLPALCFSDISLFKIASLSIKMLLNILYLSIFASILCFIMWNKAIIIIGSVKTANYIYFVPMITIISSIIVLHERVNALMIVGGILIIGGVFINENDRITNILKFGKKIKEML
ncbi:EamA family transporter [Clostridium sp. DMHC 10]|uniref:DMT family transporter n=1 Tax=Clostridium sp. DMHC 10 TaxID=747377 RepID=UPI00069E250B|nr:EamA family transporter [Clostridium sp. DMHC 10]